MSGPQSADPRRQQQLDEAVARYLEQQAQGLAPDRQEWLEAYPDLAEGLAEFWADLDRLPAAPDPGTAEFSTEGPFSEIAAQQVIAGRYTLVERIGRGGMGEVWTAKQDAPVKRRVAIKLIKAGMDSDSVLARFEAERQALAIMDHPNIARVLDGGVTRGGRPYFVMELVNGLPLTKFCDDAKLTPRERLELFVPICQAVQHAHHKGIVHRDLKPSNILVTLYDGRPVPKIIDFGVAKAIGGKLTEESLSTEFGAVVGTLEYMSPEQTGYSGLDIDTRADIYSLGVILYELLTGLRPLDALALRKAALGHMLRLIQEQEPSKPSARLSTDRALPTLAALRQTDPKRLTRMLRGELDCIVMKCLEKDRNRRYETANGVALDVQRYLGDEPVLARPPSAGYRLRKFVRRNRAAVIAGTFVVASLLAVIAGTSWALVRTRAAERRATAEARRATAVREFLTNGLLRQANPTENERAEHVTVEELLDRAAVTLEKRDDLKIEPDIEMEIQAVVADTYESLGASDKAAPHWERAFALGRELYGDEDPGRTLVTMNGWGLALLGQDKFQEAEQVFRKAVEIRRRVSGSQDAETLFVINNLGIAVGRQGRLDEAEALFRENCDTRTAVFGPLDLDTLEAWTNYARFQEVKGDLPEAERRFRQVVEGFRAKGWEAKPEALTAENGLGTVLLDQGRFDEAAVLLQDLVKRRAQVMGAEHMLTLGTRTNLAFALTKLGRFDEAIEQSSLAYESLRRQKGEEFSETLSAKNSLVLSLRGAERWDEAERHAREIVQIAEQPGFPDPLARFRFTHNLGYVYEGAGRWPEAEQAYRRALELAAASGQSDHFTVCDTKENLSVVLLNEEKYDEAIELARATLATRRRQMRPGHPRTISTGLTLARALERVDRLDEAEKVQRELAQIDGIEPTQDAAQIQLDLGRNLLRQERAAEAVEPMRKCMELADKLKVQGVRINLARSDFAEALLKAGDYAEAERQLLEALRQIESVPASTQQEEAIAKVRQRLRTLYEAWGKPDEAEKK